MNREVVSPGIRLRPPVFSARFLVVFILAFLVLPNVAMQAMVVLIRGKRLRAWNALSVAASRHSLFYPAWICLVERRLKASRRANACIPVLSNWKPLVVLLSSGADPANVDRSISMLRAAFGNEVSVILIARDACDSSSMLAALGEEGRTSPWILFLDVEDRLDQGIVTYLAREVGDPAAPALLYWDEDVQERGARALPWLKPDWDPLLFRGGTGLIGASLVRRSIFLRCVRNTPAGGGLAWLHDVLAHAAQSGAFHVPLILTHRGSRPSAVAPLQLADPTRWPAVSLIVPTRDEPELLSACLASIARLDYPGALEIILVDNGTGDTAALTLLERARQSGGIILHRPGPFNFSALNNEAAALAKGKILCFLNNDVEAADAEWLTKLVRHAVHPRVGAVGAKLLYPDGSLQHAGLAIGIGGAAGHVQKGADPLAVDHRHWSMCTRRVSAVTGACLVVRRSLFLEVGGFDAEAFAVAFNDVDFCLKLQQTGYENRYVGDAVLIHHESKSRGKDDSGEKARRFSKELLALQQRWGTQVARDPWFSPLLSRSSERCVLSFSIGH